MESILTVLIFTLKLNIIYQMSRSTEIKLSDPNPSISPLGQISREEWEMLIIRSTTNPASNVYRDFGYPVAPFHFSPSQKGPEFTFLSQIIITENHVQKDPDDILFRDLEAKRKQYAFMANQVRRNLGLIPRLSDAFNETSNLASKPQQFLWVLGITTLYLFACEPTRLLVGARGGFFWKDINIPILNGDAETVLLIDLAHIYMEYFRQVGKEELATIPTEPIHSSLVDRINLPQPRAKFADILEDAFYRQKYDIPAEDTEVLLRDAGEVQKVKMALRDPYLFGNVVTSKGEGYVVIELDTGRWMDPVRIVTGKAEEPSPWANLVASVYNFFVTEEEIPVEKYVAVHPPKTITLTPLDERIKQPYRIYLPRRSYIGERGDPRVKYEGSKRPPRFHPVRYAIPKMPMTEKHKKELAQWVAETGFRLPEIPAGHTFRRPHMSPKESEYRIRELPEFIRRRMQDDMDKQVKDQLTRP